MSSNNSLIPGTNFFIYSIRKLYWNLSSFSWDEYLETTNYASEIEKLVQVIMTKKVGETPFLLDIGCATGNYAIAFAEKNYNVTGIDYAPNMIDKAQRKAQTKTAENISFQVADFNDGLNFNSSHFDCVLAAHILHGASDVDKVLSEVKRVLKDDGLFLLITKKRKDKSISARKKSKSFLSFLLKTLKPVIFPGYRNRYFDIPLLQTRVESFGFTLISKSESGNNHTLLFKKESPPN